MLAHFAAPLGHGVVIAQGVKRHAQQQKRQHHHARRQQEARQKQQGGYPEENSRGNARGKRAAGQAAKAEKAHHDRKGQGKLCGGPAGELCGDRPGQYAPRVHQAREQKYHAPDCDVDPSACTSHRLHPPFWAIPSIWCGDGPYFVVSWGPASIISQKRLLAHTQIKILPAAVLCP